MGVHVVTLSEWDGEGTAAAQVCERDSAIPVRKMEPCEFTPGFFTNVSA